MQRAWKLLRCAASGYFALHMVFTNDPELARISEPPCDRIKAMLHEVPQFSPLDLPADAAFVAWIDLLGTSSTMGRSLHETTNAIGKLHMSVLESRLELASQVHVYPLIDGVYLVCEQQKPLLDIIKRLMRRLALNFMQETSNLKLFMPRGCISYGPVVEGRRVLRHINGILAGHADYTRFLLFGPPVARANAGERSAAPFGIWIDEPARTSPPPAERMQMTQWHWWTHRVRYPDNTKRAYGHGRTGRFDTDEHLDNDRFLAAELCQRMLSFYAWCKKHHAWIGYPEKSLAEHEALVRQYFG